MFSPLERRQQKGTQIETGLWRCPVQRWPVPQNTKTDLYDPVTCWEVRGGLQSLCPLEKGRIHVSERAFLLPVTVEDAVSGKRSPTHAGAPSDGRASAETAAGNSGQCTRRVCVTEKAVLTLPYLLRWVCWSVSLTSSGQYVGQVHEPLLV